VTIESEIVFALDAVADGNVYPAGEVDESIEPPFVAYFCARREPTSTLEGVVVITKSTFIFECWGKKTDATTAKQASLDLAAEVQAALDASTIQNRVRETVVGEEYDDAVLALMEPVQYAFWHSDGS
jgi:hypothetical protein